jgi:hypothetical protein
LVETPENPSNRAAYGCCPTMKIPMNRAFTVPTMRGRSAPPRVAFVGEVPVR